MPSKRSMKTKALWRSWLCAGLVGYFCRFSVVAAVSLSAAGFGLACGRSCGISESLICTASSDVEQPKTACVVGPYEVGEILTPETAARRNAPGMVRIFVTAFHAPNGNYAIIRPTLEALKKSFGPERVYAEVFPGGILDTKAAHLVLGSAGTYRRFAHQGTRDIATVVSARGPDPNHAEGAVFVVRSDDGLLTTLEALRGKRLAAVSNHGFAGYEIAMGEVADAGLDPEHLFVESVWTGTMTAALDTLRRGDADVAVVRTCLLEELREAGVDLSAFRVLHRKPAGVPEAKGFACVRSTDLYPNWTLFTTPVATPDMAKTAAATVLAMPPVAEGLGWSVASDFVAVDQLYFKLKIGPYAFLREWSLKRFLDEYRWAVFAVGLLFFAAVSGAIHMQRLAERRLHDWEVSELRAAQADADLRMLEKAGVIGQMSYIIAHELRQPLSSIINYAHGLTRLAETQKSRIDEAVEANAAVSNLNVHATSASAALSRIADGLARIRREAETAAGIVGHVRDYAKGKGEDGASDDPVRLDEVLCRAVGEVKILRAAAGVPIELRTEVKSESQGDSQSSLVSGACAPSAASLTVLGNALELELLFINLLKNAAEAVREGNPAVRGDAPLVVALVSSEREARTVTVTILDNGIALDNVALERLGAPLASAKHQGLGLGLTIVKSIVARHHGKITFERQAPAGLAVRVILPVAPETPDRHKGGARDCH